MGKVLRILNGRRAGAVYVLRGRTVIGRAGHVEIQLVNETVSRQHAKLSVDADGEVVLTDLSSDNGTFVNGEPVARRVLRTGDTICVADTRFVLEEAPDSVALRSSQAFAKRGTSAESLRQTAPHRIVVPTTDASVANGAGQYVRQPEVEGRPRERANTPPHAVLPGSPGPGRRRATPTGATGEGEYRHVRRPTPATAPAIPAAPAPDRRAHLPSAPRGPIDFVDGGSEDPTTPISLGLPTRSREPAAPSQPSASAPTRRERSSTPTPRPTAEYAAPEPRDASEPSLASAPHRTPSGHASRRRATAEYGAAWSPGDDERPFTEHDAPHGEDALLDVLVYRSLRLRMLRADPLDPRERARFSTLERRLERAPEDGSELSLQRRFQRLACVLPVNVRVGSPDRASPHRGLMLDVSAGGAQLRVDRATIEAGDTIWLAVELRGLEQIRPGRPGAREVLLESRVIWTSSDGARVGIIFAGEAVFVQR